LEYAAWFAVIDANQQSETDPVSLHEHLLRQSWFLRLEPAGRTKCFLITNRSNLSEARKWVDENLQRLIRKSIPPGIDPPASLLPRRLDQPVFTATSQTYADILKKQFSLGNPNTATASNNATTRPPRKRQATIFDYDSDNSAEYPPLAVNNGANSSNNTGNTNKKNQDSDGALLAIKNELNQLKEVITMAVTQIKDAVAALLADKQTNQNAPQYTSTADDTTMDHMSEAASLTQLDLQSFIADLKHELATVFMETRAVIHQPSQATTTTNNSKSKT